MTERDERPGFRTAVAADSASLRRFLAMAADWQNPEPDEAELLALPEIAHYIEGWPRAGDFGIIAEVPGEAVGAAWARFFEKSDPAYGFIDGDTPEVSIAVLPRWRGRGVGEELLRQLVGVANDAGCRQLSLSVSSDNPSRRLYARMGFVTVSEASGSETMLLRLEQP